MIDLVYQNGSVFVFDENDWLTLINEHRIVGALIGSLPGLPRQDKFRGLPMELLPEQTILLVEKNIARLVEWPALTISPDSTKVTEYDEYIKKLRQEQDVLYKNKRKLEIESCLDTIVAGKRKKCVEGSVIDKEKVLEEEINKIADVQLNFVSVPTTIDAPKYVKGSAKEVPLEVMTKNCNNLKCAVFRDLWEKSYYITEGSSFGGDYLVYLGDPIEFHASYIVKCIQDKNQTLKPIELITLGRLSTSVKKKFLFAYFDDNNAVNYQTMTWRYDL